ncbi:transposase zinc-binding domain-containing protein [Candidatus Methylomirabilis sp.]|uniref:transposase zinc-binding domain-containing protein n=1 Tax=Candidatus Methylomirabilis sp. TaxID=2032687 RepID=UPI003C71E70C
MKCKDCGHEYLMAFSCKRRHVCPSCHQKLVGEFVPNPLLCVQGRVSRHMLPLLLNEA